MRQGVSFRFNQREDTIINLARGWINSLSLGLALMVLRGVWLSGEWECRSILRSEDQPASHQHICQAGLRALEPNTVRRVEEKGLTFISLIQELFFLYT